MNDRPLSELTDVELQMRFSVYELEAVDALIPHVPDDYGNLRRLSGRAKFPEEWELGKHIQRHWRGDGVEVPYETNAELTVGMWVNRIRPAMKRALLEAILEYKE